VGRLGRHRKPRQTFLDAHGLPDRIQARSGFEPDSQKRAGRSRQRRARSRQPIAKAELARAGGQAFHGGNHLPNLLKPRHGRLREVRRDRRQRHPGGAGERDVQKGRAQGRHGQHVFGAPLKLFLSLANRGQLGGFSFLARELLLAKKGHQVAIGAKQPDGFSRLSERFALGLGALPHRLRSHPVQQRPKPRVDLVFLLSAPIRGQASRLHDATRLNARQKLFGLAKLRMPRISHGQADAVAVRVRAGSQNALACG
jgi:hypothetical protein